MKIGVTGEEVRRRWKNLRDHIVREFKKTKKKPTGSKGPPYVSRWPYFECMTFLMDSVRHRE